MSLENLHGDAFKLWTETGRVLVKTFAYEKVKWTKEEREVLKKADSILQELVSILWIKVDKTQC